MIVLLQESEFMEFCSDKYNTVILFVIAY